MQHARLTLLCTALTTLLISTASCQAAPGRARPHDATVVRSDLSRRVPALNQGAPADVRQGVHALLSAPLTEASAMRIALAKNPDVRAGYERLGVARYDLMQAGLLSNPTLSTSIKFFTAGPEVEFGLTKPLLDLLFVRHRAAIADAERSMVEAEVSASLVELLFSIRRRMLEVQSAAAVVVLRDETVSTVDATAELLAQLNETGNILSQGKTTGEIAASRVRLRLAATRAMEHDKREALRRLLGLDSQAPPLVLADSLPAELPAVLDIASLQASAEHASLHVLSKRASVLALRRSRRLVSAERRTWLRGGGVAGTREAHGEFGAGPEIDIEFPVFDSGVAAQGKAGAKYRQACAELAAVRLDARSAARRFASRCSSTREREQRLRTEYLPLRKRYIKELVERYNDMQIGAFDVLAAKIMEIGARREHVQTLRDAWLAQADLDELLAGHLNHDRLDAMDMPEEAEHPAISEGH